MSSRPAGLGGIANRPGCGGADKRHRRYSTDRGHVCPVPAVRDRGAGQGRAGKDKVKRGTAAACGAALGRRQGPAPAAALRSLPPSRPSLPAPGLPLPARSLTRSSSSSNTELRKTSDSCWQSRACPAPPPDGTARSTARTRR